MTTTADIHQDTPRSTLGQVYLPRTGTSVGQYQFLVNADALGVQIDTPVAADTPEGTVIGVVVDMITVGSMNDPFAADYATQQLDTAPLADYASQVKLATVQVYHAASLRPVSGGIVRSATPEEVALATGTDRMEAPVAAGVVELVDGDFATVNLDLHNLVGPESAHLVVGGLSGMAAKTSYAGVLLRSAMHTSREAGESMAALIFNVKGEDLVNLHLPPAAGYELSETDHEIYRAMGVPATPFADVEVYAPALPGGVGTRSSRDDASLLQWDLGTVWRYLRYFSPGLYSNDNMSAFLGDVESHKIRASNPSQRLATFHSFEAWLDSEIEDAGEGAGWRGHHPATMQRARKLIMSLPGRCGGLLTLDKAHADHDVPTDNLVDGRVMVVDIAGLEPIVQAAVIARTCERILQSAEKDELGVEHLVVFADELNMFAPASGGDLEAVRRILTKISATGRYAGVSLWGAAQFVSAVSPQVVGNAATRAAGVLPDSEVDSGVFGRMPAGQRERIVTMPKGFMGLKAHNLRGMMTVRFPRPAWQTGKPKGLANRAVRPKTTDVMGLSAASLQRLTEGVPADIVETVIAAADGDPELAARELERHREPDMEKVSVHQTSWFDSKDPWAIT